MIRTRDNVVLPWNGRGAGRGHMWRRLAGWRIALSLRLWDRSGYARVVRAWAAKSRTDRPGF